MIAETWIGRLRADVAYAGASRRDRGQGRPPSRNTIGARWRSRSISTRSARGCGKTRRQFRPARLEALLARPRPAGPVPFRRQQAQRRFNSPGFTGYVLGRVVRGKSLKSLAEEQDAQLGDIIRYENGFDMFLLQDTEGEPFVAGAAS